MELASCRARFIGTPFGLAMKPRCRRGQQRLGGHAGANVGIPGPTRIKPEAAAPLFPPDNSMSPWIASLQRHLCGEETWIFRRRSRLVRKRQP